MKQAFKRGDKVVISTVPGGTIALKDPVSGEVVKDVPAPTGGTYIGPHPVRRTALMGVHQVEVDGLVANVFDYHMTAAQ